MSKKFLFVLLGVLALALSAFFYTLYQGSNLKTVEEIISHSPFAPIVGIPYAPPAPSVTLTVYKGKNGNTLVVQWANLPASTTVLDILREPSTSTSTEWSLWQRIHLTPDQLAGGSASFDIGNNLFDGYTFTVQAANTSGNGNGSGNDQTITWTSTPTTPNISNDPPPNNIPPPLSPSTPPTTTPTSTTPTSTPTSTLTNNPPAPTSTAPTSTTPGTTPPPPSGIPYYTPEAGIAGYAQTPTGSFWVQYTNQKLEIDWQNIPASTTKAVVLRSLSQTGPWSAILTQTNPATTYSIQLVDNSLSEGYYYEMTVYNGSTVLTTYGPEYLPPYGQ